MTKKFFIMLFRVLIIIIGFFLLIGTIVLKILLSANLSGKDFMNHINNFENIYYSIITYDMNLLIWVCVPFVDLIVVWSSLKSRKVVSAYLWLVLLTYTLFFVLRFTTLQS